MTKSVNDSRKTRAFKVVLISTAVVVVSIICYFIWSQLFDLDDADFQKKRAPSTSSTTEESRGAKRGHMAAKLRRQLRSALREPSEEEETPVNIVEHSKEETRERAERTRRTTPYYWKLAPEVFEEMLEPQKADPNWSAAAKSAAKRLLARDEFEGTEVVETDCRETLCKMTLEHRDEDAYDVFKQRGATDGPWLKTDIQGKREPLDGGGVRTTLFFSKEEDPRAFEEMRERLLEKVIAIEGEGKP